MSSSVISKRRLRTDRRLSAVRPWWLHALIADAQQVAGHVAVSDVEEITATLVEFARAIRRPRGEIERILLRSVLLDVAWQYATGIHNRAHTGAAHCAFEPTATLHVFWRPPAQDPRATFLTWVEGFSTAFIATHPITVARRVSRLIKQDYQHAWKLSELARRFHLTTGQLRRRFKKEWGVSIQEYHQTIRVIAALKHLPKGKTDAIALEAGWRSTKNFYRAFENVTGLKFAAFRRLPAERALQVVVALGVARSESPRTTRHRRTAAT